ncbi:MAG TPA: DSD1 family PLP-dependent enzyme [Candidatus Acidoferrum sp.]|nr:DSD1 family PLP-dependent enzyme [Candidatus Acidoferrum sp.]
MADTASKSLGPNAKFIGVKGSRARLSTPALLLDLDVLERNIAAMAAHTKAAGIKLRPHSKGAKSIEIGRRQMAAGAAGICCSTLGEAEVIAGSGIEGVLITSPVVTPAMIERLMSLNAKAKGLMVAADNPANVDALAAAAEKAGKPLAVIVEFDVGQGRTGTISIEAAVALARRVKASPHLRYAGIQAYYGHLQHIAAHADRAAAANSQMARVRDLLAQLRAAALAPEIVTGGGTGTFDIDPAGQVYTEIQPGSYPFMDREYLEVDLAADRRPSPFAPALFVQASVVSANRAGFAVVNAGYKSFATEGGMPLVYVPKLAATKYKLMGDEHGGIDYDPQSGTLKVGDLVEFLTPHCDPTINLYDRYHCVRGDTLVDIWPVDARGC